MHAAILTACLFALTGLCATQASRLLGGGLANLLRLALAVIMLATWSHSFGSGFRGYALPWFLLAGGIGFGLGGWCVFQALRRIGSTLTLLIVECAAAVFATAIAWTWLGASLSTAQLVAAASILTGVVIGMSPAPIPLLSKHVLFAGCALALAAAFFQAISFNLSRHAFNLIQEAGLSAAPLSAAYQRLVGGVCIALPLYALTRYLAPRKPEAPEIFKKSPLPAPVWVLLNALFGPVLGVSAMLWAISMVPNPGLVQAVAATATLLTVPLAYILEGARPARNYYLGCLLALGGTAVLLIV